LEKLEARTGIRTSKTIDAHWVERGEM